MTRTIVIGDIHGCYDELIQLLEKLHLETGDQVVAVGDLTVKGPKSRDVLDLFRRDERFSSVIGNHDLALVRCWRGEEIALTAAQKRTFDELRTKDDGYLRYLSSLPFLINLNSHVVVHAGLRPEVPLEKQSPEDLVELRTLGEDRTSREGTPWYEVYQGPAVVLFGHWPARQPRLGKYAVGLDTGCVYGGKLTGYTVESGEVSTVSAPKAYDNSHAIS
jgi:hypothetical protein